jgi:DNA-binding MarR family transcriptional regulator
MVVKTAAHPKDDLLVTLGLGYLGQFLSQRVNELVLAHGRRKGFAQMRTSYGYVIQHLVERDHTVSRTGSELARRMGVSQQAASKAIAELVRLGVVEVTACEDRRAKQVSLSARGWDAVQMGRRYRASVEERLRRHVGHQRYAEAQKTLRDCLGLLGGVDRIRSRRIRQPE